MKDLLIKIPRYLALFFVSAYTLGLVILLVRFFALAAWSEYGVAVTAVAFSGVAISGVCLALFPDFFARRRAAILFWLPFVLLFVSALAFQLIALNRFNPFLMQGCLWPGQVLNLLYYVLALLPVFFLAGLFIGLSFLDLSGEIAQASACHLFGGAAGWLLVFVCQSFIHPFQLLAVLLPVLALAALARLFVLRYTMFLTGLALLFFITGFGMWRVLDGNHAHIPGYKAVSSAMRVEGNRVLNETPTPGGYYHILDNFTERRAINLSHQYGFPRVAQKPVARGLYRDGARILGLYREGNRDRSYFDASLDAFPYRLKPLGTYLFIGTDGGFKIHELWGEKRTIRAVEPTRTVYELVRQTISGMGGISLSCSAPLGVLEPRAFDLIDMGSTFLAEGEANRYALTIEAVSRYFYALKDDGLLSLPVATAGFSAYALKLLDTVDQSLRRIGVDDPGKHILVYRSASGARILVSRKGFTDQAIAALQAFCRERSFDISWYPGIEPNKNSVLQGHPAAGTIDQNNRRAEQADALRHAALNLFQIPRTASSTSVLNLEPATLDRPFFHDVFPVRAIPTLLKARHGIPRVEIGQLINPAMLFLASIMGVCVILLPLIRKKEVAGPHSRLRMAVYFACLGLGMVFITRVLSERCAFFLNDTATAVTVIVCAMLFFSGCGSYRTSKLDPFSDRGIKWSIVRIITCLVLYVFLLIPVLSVLLPLAGLIKVVTMLIITAPVAFIAGMPFPLGLACLNDRAGFFLPWALGVYVIFSVIAIPLGQLLAVAWGLHVLLFISVFLYFIALWAYPAMAPGTAGKECAS